MDLSNIVSILIFGLSANMLSAFASAALRTALLRHSILLATVDYELFEVDCSIGWGLVRLEVAKLAFVLDVAISLVVPSGQHFAHVEGFASSTESFNKIRMGSEAGLCFLEVLSEKLLLALAYRCLHFLVKFLCGAEEGLFKFFVDELL